MEVGELRCDSFSLIALCIHRLYRACEYAPTYSLRCLVSRKLCRGSLFSAVD